jgi:hypothetical protein
VPTYPRALSTPVLDVQAFASRLTARASHPHTLAALATDAAGGHPSQRWSVSRVVGTRTAQWYYESASVARYLRAQAVVARLGSMPAPLSGALLTLTVTDGTTTVTAAPLPAGLLGDVTHVSAFVAASWPRLETASTTSWVIDLDALRALLTASTTWRWSLAVVAAAEVALESWVVEELPRFAIDTGDDYGQPPQDYLPRGIVRDGSAGLQRVGVTLEHAYDRSLRTYHAQSRDPGSPWSTTSTVYAALGQDSEPGGTAMRWRVRPRRMHGAASCRAILRLRYRLVGATAGDTATLRVVTSVGTYDVVLADTAGAWSDASLTVRLDTSAADRTDTLTFTAKTTSGTLEIAARTVLDDPE